MSYVLILMTIFNESLSEMIPCHSGKRMDIKFQPPEKNKARLYVIMAKMIEEASGIMYMEINFSLEAHYMYNLILWDSPLINVAPCTLF